MHRRILCNVVPRSWRGTTACIRGVSSSRPLLRSIERMPAANAAYLRSEGLNGESLSGWVNTLTTHKDWSPTDVAIDRSGNVLISSGETQKIHRVTRGAVSTLAGTSTFGGEDLYHEAMAVAEDGTVYTTTQHMIQKIDAGEVSIVAGSSEGFKNGPLSQACFNYPRGLALAKDGSLIVADSGNHCIRRVAPEGVTTLAGSGKRGNSDGPSTEASFDDPAWVAIGPNGFILVTDWSGRLRCISPQGWVSTISSAFCLPSGLLVDCRGNALVADARYGQLIFCTPLGEMVVVAGKGGSPDFVAPYQGPGREIQFDFPVGLALDREGRVLVADASNYRVQVVSLPSTLRLQEELLIVQRSFSSWCVVRRCSRNLFAWEASIKLPEAERLHGKGPFQLSLEMPFDYPRGAPLMKFVGPHRPVHPLVDPESGVVKYLVWGIPDALKTVRELLTTDDTPTLEEHTSFFSIDLDSDSDEQSGDPRLSVLKKIRHLPTPSKNKLFLSKQEAKRGA